MPPPPTSPPLPPARFCALGAPRRALLSSIKARKVAPSSFTASETDRMLKFVALVSFYSTHILTVFSSLKPSPFPINSKSVQPYIYFHRIFQYLRSELSSTYTYSHSITNHFCLQFISFSPFTISLYYNALFCLNLSHIRTNTKYSAPFMIHYLCHIVGFFFYSFCLWSRIIFDYVPLVKTF
jgi:hypothetical protein